MMQLLLLIMLCYGHAYFVECINRYEDHEAKRLCIDARYWEIMAKKFNDKLNQCYQDC